jgi:hypothetical protein
MTTSSRLLLAVLAMTLVMAAPAAADSVKVQVPGTNSFLYVSQEGAGGEFGVCLEGRYFGGTGPSNPDGWAGDAEECATRTGDTTLPPSGGGGAPAPPCDFPAGCLAAVTDQIGGGAPAPPCTDPVECLVQVFGCDSQASCQAKYFPDGGGGGGAPAPPGGTPAPPCTDPAQCFAQVFGCDSQASCQAKYFPGGGGGGGAPAPPGGAPGSRECTSSTGGAAMCFDLGDGNFLLGDPPDDGKGELGFCTTSDQAPAGAGYYYVSGPSPDGGAGEACPGAAATPASTPPPSSGGSQPQPQPQPEPDKDNDGVADSGDRCPTVAASTSDGCPPQSSGEGTSGGTEQTTTREPAQSRPSEPAEAPRIDITRRRLGVSRRGKVAIPLKCETTRVICRGTLKLTATRRTKSGRRVRVVVARAEFLVPAGGTLNRKVRLTRAGRRLLAANRRVRTRAKFVLVSSSGKVTRRDRVTLRRR